MQLSDLDPNKRYTYADYYKWDFPERVELINGKVYQMFPAPNSYHQDISGEIFNLLKNFLHHKACKVYIAPFDVRLVRKSKEDKDIITVLQPDVCVLCDLSKRDKRGCLGAPDLVVEVLSPGNSTKEMKYKYEVYEEAGVKEYWVVSPQNQLLFIYLLQDGKFQAEHVKMPGDIAVSTAIPGFSIDLAELFSEFNADEA